jgi:hypothetical protein
MIASPLTKKTGLFRYRRKKKRRRGKSALLEDVVKSSNTGSNIYIPYIIVCIGAGTSGIVVVARNIDS